MNTQDISNSNQSKEDFYDDFEREFSITRYLEISRELREIKARN